MNENMVTLAAGDPGVWVGGVLMAGFFSLLIVIVRQTATTWRAKMLAAQDRQYKELALKYAELLEDNVELHRRTLDEQRLTREELTQARTSVSAMEKMMREIE